MGLLDTPGLVDLAEVRWRTGDLARCRRGRAAVALRRGCRAIRWPSSSRPRPRRRSAARTRRAAWPTARRRTRPAGSTRSSPGCRARASGRPTPAEPPPTAPTLFDRDARGDPSAPTSRVGTRPRATAHGTHPPAGARRRRSRSGCGMTRASPSRRRRRCPIRRSSSRPVARPSWRARSRRRPATSGSPSGSHRRSHRPFSRRPTARASSSLTMVRGDAYRLAGHESEARQAYAIAAQGGLPERRSRSRTMAGRARGRRWRRQPTRPRAGVHGGRGGRSDHGGARTPTTTPPTTAPDRRGDSATPTDA